MAYMVKQISNIVNDAVKDALGKNTNISTLDSTDIVSLGKALDTYEAYEGFFKSLANRITKTVYFVRAYKGKSRHILRDEHEWGAFVQKVYYDMPDSVDNPTWSIPDEDDQYAQASPYDVENVVAVSSLVFGGKGTWSIEIIRPIEQIKSAFLSNSDMMRFIDGIYTTVENKMKLDMDRLEALACNTGIASCLKGGKSRNLLNEYNTHHPDATLTVAQALESAEFLRFASKEINDTISFMGNMSTAFNKAGYATFTSKENLVVEMLTTFASATDMYLQADTFHDELVALPKYEKVDFWQTSGKNYSFNAVSAIKIDHDDINGGATVSQGGIIAFLHDVEYVAAYFGNRRTWEMVNPRSEVVIHGEKAEKGYAVDDHANAVVFYVA